MAKHPNKNSFLIFCSVEINWRSLFTEKFNQQLSHTQPAAAESQLRVQMLRRQRCSYTRRACGIIVQHLLLLLETATGGLSGVFEPPTKAPRSVVTHWYQIAHFNSKGAVLWRFCKNILILGHFQFRKNTQKRVYFVCGRISDKFWPTLVVNS